VLRGFSASAASLPCTAPFHGAPLHPLTRAAFPSVISRFGRKKYSKIKKARLLQICSERALFLGYIIHYFRYFSSCMCSGKACLAATKILNNPIYLQKNATKRGKAAQAKGKALAFREAHSSGTTETASEAKP
jgi:hypothetical protein